MTDDIITMLSSEQIAEYGANGFVIVRGLFTKERMQVFKADTQAIVRAQHPDSRDGVPVFFLDGMPDVFQHLCCGPEITTVVHQLLGPRIEFLSVKPVHKDATVTFPSAWHQDYAYWGGSNKLSVWLALDDATIDNGCLRFVPGAHRKFIKHNTKDGSFAKYLTDEQLDLASAVDAPMAAGDACFFIDLSPHASYGNVSGRDRWSLIPTYRNADQVDESEVWTKSIYLG